MPHSAHLGVEAVGFAELVLARCLVAQDLRQLGSHLKDLGLERARARLIDPLARPREACLDILPRRGAVHREQRTRQREPGVDAKVDAGLTLGDVDRLARQLESARRVAAFALRDGPGADQGNHELLPSARLANEVERFGGDPICRLEVLREPLGAGEAPPADHARKAVSHALEEL